MAPTFIFVNIGMMGDSNGDGAFSIRSTQETLRL